MKHTSAKQHSVLRAALTALLCCALFLCACGENEAIHTETEETSETIAPTNPALKKVVISEVMTHNGAVLQDEDGDFSDWIELYNGADCAVELGGCVLSDGGARRWQFPECRMESGEYLLLFASGKDKIDGELHTAFSLSDGETLTLYAENGEELTSFLCPDCAANESAILTDDGEITVTDCPTPESENSAESYITRQESLAAPDTLRLSEAMSANTIYPLADGTLGDWAEIYNASSAAVSLSDYTLSDDLNEPGMMHLPDITLQPGEYYAICTEFGLSADGDSVYLSDNEGELMDYMPLTGIPGNCSCGRGVGEGGFYYYAEPTPGEANNHGERRVSAKPEVLTTAGVYDNITSLPVAFSETEGVIRYTLDGSEPDETSNVYSESITLTETTVLRAVLWEENALPGECVTLNYIINEGHTLPVLCMTADTPDELDKLINKAVHKDMELSGNLSFYESDGSFSVDCGISLSGVLGSLTLPKKSFKIHFRSAYGESRLDYDIFDRPVQSFSSLTVRAGQDNYSLFYRNELWEELCLELSDDALTLYSRFCVLYINGEYAGIYCLKEDFSKTYYADHAGVSKSSVETERFPIDYESAFYKEVISFCEDNDFTEEENYRELCERIDVDSFIDWFIMEGVSANIDLYRNIRVFRSPENGNRWQFAFYDLDLVKESYTAPFSVCFGHSDYLSEQMTDIVLALCSNAEFRVRLFTRYGEVYDTILSNESVLTDMDEFEELLRPEMERECERWHGGSDTFWRNSSSSLRYTIRSNDWQNCCVDNLLYWLRSFKFITEDEAAEIKAQYFS